MRHNRTGSAQDSGSAPHGRRDASSTAGPIVAQAACRLLGRKGRKLRKISATGSGPRAGLVTRQISAAPAHERPMPGVSPAPVAELETRPARGHSRSDRDLIRVAGLRKVGKGSEQSCPPYRVVESSDHRPFTPRRISSYSDNSSTSSTSMPRRRTMLSSFRWPSRSWQARSTVPATSTLEELPSRHPAP